MKKLIFLLLLLISCSTVFAQSKPTTGANLIDANSLTVGLYSVWLANEGTGTSIADYNEVTGNDATMSDATWGTGQWEPNCISFDGNQDYVYATDYADIFDANFTISFWIYNNATDLSSRAVTYYYDTQNYVQIAISADFGSVYNIGITGKIDNVESGISNAGVSPSEGEWYHVVFVYNGSYTMYINNAAQESVSFTGYGIGTNTGLTLGIRNDYSSSDFTGMLDVVMIYTRALSSDEVNVLYTDPFCMFEEGGSPPASSGSGSQVIIIN